MEASSTRLPLGRAVKNWRAMGSPCEIQLYAPDPATAERLIAAAVAEIERLEQKFSRFRPDSDLSRVNRAAQAGTSAPIDAEMRSLLGYADACHQMSDGLFDITAGALRTLWHAPRDGLPDAAAVSAVLSRVGWHHVTLDEGEIRFAQAGLDLDLGGIVKEYAADAAAAVLVAQGVTSGVVNMGGDVVVIGPHPDGQPWGVAIAHPAGRTEPLARIALTRGAVASSGDYERFIEIDGERFGHIISPETGWPVRGLTAVSVAAERCVLAGSACTIAMLKDSSGPAFLRDGGLPALWVDRDGQGGVALGLGGLGTFTHFHP